MMFHPESLIPDGRYHRFHVPGDRPSSKNGWYRCFSENPRIGSFGSWKTGETFTWGTSSAGQYANTCLPDVADHRNQLRERCQKRAHMKLMHSVDACAEHPYLRGKHVPPLGIRQLNGNLLIPCRDTDKKLWGLQIIKPDGEKRFLTGTCKRGHYYSIGGQPVTCIYLTEGFATGASVHLATAEPVAVAFDAGNLLPVARALKAKYPAIKIVICADDDQWTSGNPGVRKAREAAEAVGGLLATPTFKECSDKPTDFNDLHCREGITAVRQQLREVSSQASGLLDAVGPLPLRREIPPGGQFPLDTFPKVLRDMAEALMTTVQAPEAIIGQSLLAAAALATQGHADLHLDGRTLPISLYLVSLAISGERKSAIDRLVLKPHRDHQKTLSEEQPAQFVAYQAGLDAWKKARSIVLQDKGINQTALTKQLVALGREPKPPLDPVFMTEDPTFEGLVKLLLHGQPSVGIFSDEGGRFLGGYAMSEQHQLKTAAGLSKLWDGDPLTRTRSGDGNLILYGRRCSLHLMLQPELAPQLFANTLLLGQGLLSRCLVTYPASNVGQRRYRAEDIWQLPGAQRYDQVMQSLLQAPYALREDVRNELEPRPLGLTPDAKEHWATFHNQTEALCRPGGLYEPIRGFALKGPEHALRISGVLTLVENLHAADISLAQVEAGCQLTSFYLSEALRLHHAVAEQPELLLAEKCLDWIARQGRYFATVDLYQNGPTAVRNKQVAEQVLSILERHRWIRPVTGSMKIKGRMRQEVWENLGPDGSQED